MTGASSPTPSDRRLDDLVRLLCRRGAVQLVSGSEVGGRWLRHGWHVAVAYTVGYFVMLAIIGWHPNGPLKPH